MTDTKRSSNTSLPQGQLRYYIGERRDCLRIMKSWFSRTLTKKEIYTLCGAPPHADVFVGTLADSLYFEFYDHPCDSGDFHDLPTIAMTGAMSITENKNTRSFSLMVYSYGTLRPMCSANDISSDVDEYTHFLREEFRPPQVYLCQQLGITKIITT